MLIAILLAATPPAAAAKAPKATPGTNAHRHRHWKNICSQDATQVVLHLVIPDAIPDDSTTSNDHRAKELLQSGPMKAMGFYGTEATVSVSSTSIGTLQQGPPPPKDLAIRGYRPGGIHCADPVFTACTPRPQTGNDGWIYLSHGGVLVDPVAGSPTDNLYFVPCWFMYGLEPAQNGTQIVTIPDAMDAVAKGFATKATGKCDPVTRTCTNVTLDP